MGYGLAGYGFYDRFKSKGDSGEPGDSEAIVNWSGTHGCTPVKLHEPESAAEIYKQMLAQQAGSTEREIEMARYP